MSNRIQNVRLLTLDGMRGLAALLVVLYHLEFLGPFAESGYLAVDFFFLLSGVVIARAYDERLNNNLSISQFLAERFIRLYPLFLIGFIVGFLRSFSQILMHHPQQLGVTEFIFGSLFNFVLLPSPFSSAIAPINGPSWSLMMEVLVNLIWAVFLVRVKQKYFAWIVVVLGIMATGVFLHYGSASGGPHWSTIHSGLLRAMFGFSFGVFLNKYILPSVPRISKWAFLPCAILCGMLVVIPPPEFRVIYDITTIIFVFPLLVAAGAAYNPPRAFWPIARALGDLSYPLYVLHYSLLFTTSYVAQKLGISPWLWVPGFFGAMIPISLLAARWYDPKAKRWLNRQLIDKFEHLQSPTAKNPTR